MQDVREIPNIDEIKKNIRKYFDDYCAAYGIDDMRSQRQPVFNGAMQYIYNNYIRPNNVLKDIPKNIVDNSINQMLTNYNAYNIDLLYEVYLYLRELANAYDMTATADTFKILTGISKQALSAWRTKSSTSSMDEVRKAFVNWLDDADCDQLVAFNLRNALGATERLNNDHGRKQTTQQEIVHKITRTADQLPRLDTDFGQNKSMLTDSGAYDDSNVDANE